MLYVINYLHSIFNLKLILIREKIVGSEALARLIKDNKVIYPDQFIEIMEKTKQ